MIETGPDRAAMSDLPCRNDLSEGWRVTIDATAIEVEAEPSIPSPVFAASDGSVTVIDAGPECLVLRELQELSGTVATLDEDQAERREQLALLTARMDEAVAGVQRDVEDLRSTMDHVWREE